MPPSPIKPMNRPWPTHSGHDGPRLDSARPQAIISAPQLTVQRVPTRSAMRPMMMPPMPEPNQASALASAGTERTPPTSPAMSFNATAVIQAAPNDIISAHSAAAATTHEALVSIDDECDCNIGRSTPAGGPFY